MVKSKYCSTNIKQDLKGECRYDPGGYFIVGGAEKVVMSMEKMVDNKILIFSKKDTSVDGGLIYTAQINSRRNDWSDNLQILTIKNRKDGVLTISTSSQLVDIPIFILMRALGVEADQTIISHITYDLDDIKMMNTIRPSVANSMDDEGNMIRTKEEAIEYLITKLRRNKRISQTDEAVAKIQKKMYLEKILRQDLLPHLGEDITKKIVFIGMMANRLINTILGRKDVDDRDALQNKRIEPPGILLGQLFRQNWKKMLNEIGKLFKKKNHSDEQPINIIGQVKPSTIEQGLKTALATGIWGMNKTKKGVAQSLQRLSWVQAISSLRRILAPSMDETTAKVTSIRFVNNNQMNLLCCLTEDASILLSNRMNMKKIINVVDGDSVTTVNRTTLHEEPSRIYNKFGRMSEKLFEIKTISGRTIKATHDHPFLTYIDNKYVMKKAEDLKDTDKLVIRHMEEMIVPEKETTVIINSNDVLKTYYMELLELGYLDKPITHERLICIARLLGSNITDGHLGFDGKYYQAQFSVGEEVDTFSVTDDISKLGFGQPYIQRYNSFASNEFTDKTNGRVTNYATWRVTKSGAFAYLLKLLGCFDGKKTEMIRTIPEWIMKADKLIKREFLSAFQGGDGSKISYETFRISIGNTSQTTLMKYEEETKRYMNQYVQLFKEFDINSHVETHKISEDKIVIDLIFEKTAENITRYADMIGYRYCEEKRRKSAPAIEHLKIRHEVLCDKMAKYNKLIPLLGTDKTGSELAKMCDLSVTQVDKIRSKFRKGETLPTPRFTCQIIYNDFNKEYILPTGYISIGIKSIKEIPNEMVYDFTTTSENHSFIANSFVVSNCSETPEGGKIGIVKSLAMMSGITVQNASQSDVFKNLIKMNKMIKHPYDVNPLTMNSLIKIFVNGDWCGVCKISEGQDIYNSFKKARRDNIIDKFTSILFDYRNKEIRVYFDGGRLIRPILIVSNNKLNLTPEAIADITTEYNLADKSKSWKRIINKYSNLIEYEDIESLNYLMVAMNEERMIDSITAGNRKVEYKDNDNTKINRYGDYRFINYTHCDFSSWVMLGPIVGNIPFSDHNYANRNIIHFSQAKQSIGIYMSSYKDRMDISQVLYHPQVPLVTTQAMKYNSCMDLPYGENAIIAICSYTG